MGSVPCGELPSYGLSAMGQPMGLPGQRALVRLLGGTTKGELRLRA